MAVWQAADEAPWTDEELTILALSADPETPPPPDATPFVTGPASGSSLLPNWYMPAAITRNAKGWQRIVIFSIVGALLVLEALGLCSIFGQVVIG